MFRRDFLKFLAVVPIVGNFDLKNLFEKNPTLKNDLNEFLVFKAQNHLGLSSIWSDLKTGDHLVIGARPAMGKTSVAMNMLNELSINQKITAVYFGLEDANFAYMNRLLSIRTGIPLAKIKTGKLDDHEYEKLISESKTISGAKFYMDDSTYGSVDGIVSKIKKLKKTIKILNMYLSTMFS